MNGCCAIRTTRRSCPTSGRFGWNSLRIAGVIPDGELLEALDASYRGAQQAAQEGPPGARGARGSAEPDGLG